jgi:hypothetical protein
VQLDAISAKLAPVDRAFREHYLREVREALGEAGLAAPLTEGWALTLEQALHEALEGMEE